MALITHHNIGITAISACVPKNKVKNINETQYFDTDSVKAVIDKTGVIERRVVSEEVCASDLCFTAAETLLVDNNISRNEIDALIFVSQTPDYRMPATSITLQHRLGITKEVFAFDVGLGCTGFIAGLNIAYGLLQNSGINKVLLLNGETRSKAYSKKDRSVAFLFGDAGSAALIEKSEKFGDSFFSFGTAGKHADFIMIPAGGYRKQSSIETLKEKVVDDYGNIRSEEHGYMKGEQVFNLFINEMPNDIKRILEFSGTDKQMIDYVVMHEGSKFLASYIKKILKLPIDRVPSIMDKFGNTSSVSIPLNVVSELNNHLKGRKKIFMTVMGVGMTWASCIIDTVDCSVSALQEI